MGSLVTVRLSCKDEAQCDAAFIAATDTLVDLENKMTLYRPSELTRVNAASGRDAVPVSGDTFRVAETALRIAEDSEGFFDPTVSPALESYGLYTLHAGETVPDVPATALSRLIPLINFRNVVLQNHPNSIRLIHKGMKLDFGGIAKGYALDRIADRLDLLGIDAFSLNFGGHLLVREIATESVVQHPETGIALLRCRIVRGSISASAQNRRFVHAGKRRVGHIVNPRALGDRAGAERIAVVQHASAMIADAWSTALFFPPPHDFSRLTAKHKIHAIRFGPDGKWLQSAEASQHPVCVSTNP